MVPAVKKLVHSAFWRRKRDRLIALLTAGLALVPMGMPREIADWLSQQAPWCPSWVHWVAAIGILAWRLDAGRKSK